jgi:hypothetical protein
LNIKQAVHSSVTVNGILCVLRNRNFSITMGGKAGRLAWGRGKGYFYDYEETLV